MIIRPYKNTDKSQLNALALEAFSQYRNRYNDWGSIQAVVGNMSSLANSSEIIVAEVSGIVVGGVAFVPPGGDAKGHFDISWASIRMLVVSPNQRGKGIGKQLTLECIKRARDKNVKFIGLHTSPMMEVALSMYSRMGFTKIKDLEPIFGVEYSTYKLQV
ncbi:MAG: GNAT family N-acetyltransferase [SAR324 cluster bacterium]|uniref:GNAT family N-acetyltransferase n=1 Tax=SAR324 cluster bacterium TaxID=2024889 RepID=A0A2A4STB8_9DELT|nr:MAG: GNAT family N-acetyltransferase [SAR324 cluster bacterium]